MIVFDTLAHWKSRRRAVKRRFNPYIAGTPVFDRQLFFGREPLARATLARLATGSILLTGERRIGKTSFLHHLRSCLVEPASAGARSFPVFVDLENVTAAGFFRAVIEETLDTLALAAPGLAQLRARAACNGYAPEDLRSDLRRVIGELRAWAGRPVRLVLLIDEIERLRESSERALDDWLAPLVRDAAPELRLVVAGQGDGPDARGGAPELERIALEPLAAQDAEALVTRPVAPVFHYESGAVERILGASRLRPFEIQRLCLHAVDRMLDAERTTVRLADVVAPA